MGMMWYRSREEFDNPWFQWGIKVDETEHEKAPFVRAAATSTSKQAKPISDVQSYLLHQANKFSNTFDANAYLLLSRGMDQFDLGWSANRWVPGFKDAVGLVNPPPSALHHYGHHHPTTYHTLTHITTTTHPPTTHHQGAGGRDQDARLERALNLVTAKVQVIGVVQDALIPLSEQKNVYETLKKNEKNVTFVPIDDLHGHDAMFNKKVFGEKFGPIISKFVEADGGELDANFERAKAIESAPEEVLAWSRFHSDGLGSFARTVMGARAGE